MCLYTYTNITDMIIVSERLGHTEINITMNIYSHILEEIYKKEPYQVWETT